jgi:hypothetical protein
MALKTNVTIKHLGQDVVFNDAYVRVFQVQANKPLVPSEIYPNNPPPNSRATVMFYSDDTLQQQIKVYHYELDYDFSPSAKNPWEQTYDYLKTLPEFADATDC